MIPVITSFLPPSHTHLFLPSLFKIWEAFNSSVVDERLLELAGELSEGQVSAKPGDVGGSEWKDVGIWNETQWKLILSKGVGSMS
jgi:proteasome activator subunit 4